MMSENANDEQITAYMVDRYGSFVRNKRMDSQVTELVQCAPAIDPTTPKALWPFGLERYITQAGGGPPQADIRQAATRPASASVIAGATTVHVELDPAPATQAAPDDTVFIFARAQQGAGMPRAIVREQEGYLPLQVTLDDAQSMAPGMSISKFPRVVSSARISKLGDSRLQASDLEGLSRPLQTGSKRIARVRIDQVMQ
ncbi:MAG: hypothetical protein JSW48_09625 [Betaproteobacteria bacterium]|jgi:cytochrome c-type biogenesis protein CcmH|nr:MAG: hypothetical protein JSW48_09625 [Betaproteobacteria bacterium]